MLRGTDTGCGREWNMIFTSVSNRGNVETQVPLLSKTYPRSPLKRPSLTMTLTPSFSVSRLSRLPRLVEAQCTIPGRTCSDSTVSLESVRGGALDVDEVAPDALDGAGFALVVALDDPDGVVLLDLALLGVEERGVARDVVLFGADEVEVEGAELALLVEDGELLRGELDDDADWFRTLYPCDEIHPQRDALAARL